jgi:hypothetical protein
MQREVLPTLLLVVVIALASAGCGKSREPAQKEPAQAAPAQQAPVAKETKTAAVPAAPAPATVPSRKPITEERVLFSFEEEDLAGWEIPFWALEKEDHVASAIAMSKEMASEGEASMKVDCNFPGGIWSAAVLELEQYLDFAPYREVAVDVYIPEDTPLGLRGKIILTVGNDWKFTEMTRTIPLVPGKWVTIKASIEPGSYDWKRTICNEAFRSDVRKVVVRVESNRRPVYQGPVYIDNFRIRK